MNESEFGLNAEILFNGCVYIVSTLSVYNILEKDFDAGEHILETGCSNQFLGSAARDALNQSREIPLDEVDAFHDAEKADYRYKAWIEATIKRLGYRSKRALFDRMHRCGIRLADGVITIRPSNHDRLEGWSGEGIDEDDYVVIPEKSTPEEIGAAVRLAFTRCRGRGPK